MHEEHGIVKTRCFFGYLDEELDRLAITQGNQFITIKASHDPIFQYLVGILLQLLVRLYLINQVFILLVKAYMAQVNSYKVQASAFRILDTMLKLIQDLIQEILEFDWINISQAANHISDPHAVIELQPFAILDHRLEQRCNFLTKQLGSNPVVPEVHQDRQQGVLVVDLLQERWVEHFKGVLDAHEEFVHGFLVVENGQALQTAGNVNDWYIVHVRVDDAH